MQYCPPEAEVVWGGAWLLGSWLWNWGLGALTPARLYSGSLFEGSSTSLFDWKPCWLQPISEMAIISLYHFHFVQQHLKLLLGESHSLSPLWHAGRRRGNSKTLRKERVSLHPDTAWVLVSALWMTGRRVPLPVVPCALSFSRLRHKEASRGWEIVRGSFVTKARKNHNDLCFLT